MAPLRAVDALTRSDPRWVRLGFENVGFQRLFEGIHERSLKPWREVEAARRVTQEVTAVKPVVSGKTERLRTSLLAESRVVLAVPASLSGLHQAARSGADLVVADFEDSFSPRLENILEGQVALRTYLARSSAPRVMLRPRGLHLEERHLAIEGMPTLASAFDVSAFLWSWNLERRGEPALLCIPKLESPSEAEIWSHMLQFAERELEMKNGHIQVMALLETVPAMIDPGGILDAFGERLAAVGSGRADYLFSFLKCFGNDPTRVLGDRSALTMGRPFLKAYSQRLVLEAHSHGVPVFGGVAANLPGTGDASREAMDMAKLAADKRRELGFGFDGTWVAHPDLIPHVRALFDPKSMAKAKEEWAPDSGSAEASPLFDVVPGVITASGLESAIETTLRYLASWLRGDGLVTIDGHLEDAATAEVCRMQVWQWVRHRRSLDDGRPIDERLVMKLLAAATEKVGSTSPQFATTLPSAQEISQTLFTAAEPIPYLTAEAYGALLSHESAPSRI